MRTDKICFIYCVNDEMLFNESAAYIRALEIPDEYEIDIISIKEANSITEGYNYAMQNTDAKYKVYLHQDTFIVNKRFIYDILDLFQNNLTLGMLGVVGAETIPLNAVWWESERKYGKIYESHTGKMELLAFQEIETDYKSVKALDGCILVTQYDLPWRSDLLQGWHFYDLSQCMEFVNAGYDVGIPFQGSPWCIHDCGIVNVKNGFFPNSEKFLEEYSKDLFPLVSILIPAYNRPHYLELALQSALNQTYKNIEIIISDDSTNDEVEQMLYPYLSKNNKIIYIKNEPSLGRENFVQCFKLANGEFVNFLMDDDLFHPQKIERMIKYYLSVPNVTLVTSYRQLIDESGYPLPPQNYNAKIFDEDTLVKGKELGDHVLSNMLNLIGEPTTVLFRKKDVQYYGTYRDTDHEYNVLIDLSMWIELLSQGNAIYIAEPLSYFRKHGGQTQDNPIYYYYHISNWYNILQDARRDGFLSDPSNYRKALHNYLSSSLQVIDYYNRKDLAHIITENKLESYIVSALNEFVTTPSSL